MSEEFKKFLDQHSIIHSCTTAYNPQGNGIAEQAMQEISKGLRMLEDKNLDETIKKIEKASNHLYHRIIGTTPRKAFTGKNEMDDEKIKRTADQINQNVLKNYKENLTVNEQVYEIGQKIWLKKTPK